MKLLAIFFELFTLVLQGDVTILANAYIQPAETHLDSLWPWPFNRSTALSIVDWNPVSFPLVPSKEKVAVLMTGNVRSFDMAFKHSFTSYFKFVHRKGYDLFLATSEMLDPMSNDPGSPRLLNVEDWVSIVKYFGGTIKRVDLVTTPYTYNGGGECTSSYFYPFIRSAAVKPFQSQKGNKLALLSMYHKFSLAFASMRAEELLTNSLYDYVFRCRTDMIACRPFPPAAAMFAFYRDSRSTGERDRGDVNFGGRRSRNVPTEIPLFADIVMWDDQMALMPRSSADAYFLGVQKVATKCYTAAEWSIACGLPYEVAEQRLKESGGASPLCRETRLVSVEFDVIVRDCGDTKREPKNCGVCERADVHSALKRKSIAPLMTTEHWNGGLKNCNASGGIFV